MKEASWTILHISVLCHQTNRLDFLWRYGESLILKTIMKWAHVAARLTFVSSAWIVDSSWSSSWTHVDNPVVWPAERLFLRMKVLMPRSVADGIAGTSSSSPDTTSQGSFAPDLNFFSTRWRNEYDGPRFSFLAAFELLAAKRVRNVATEAIMQPMQPSMYCQYICQVKSYTLSLETIVALKPDNRMIAIVAMTRERPRMIESPTLREVCIWVLRRIMMGMLATEAEIRGQETKQCRRTHS